MQNWAPSSKLSQQFVGGSTLENTIQRIQLLDADSIYASLFYLGEYVEDQELIKKTIDALEDGIGKLSQNNLDIHVSIDPTQIGLLQSKELCKQNLLKLANTIQLHQKKDGIKKDFLMIDMEDSSVTEQTIDFYKLLKKHHLPRCYYSTNLSI